MGKSLFLYSLVEMTELSDETVDEHTEIALPHIIEDDSFPDCSSDEYPFLHADQLLSLSASRKPTRISPTQFTFFRVICLHLFNLGFCPNETFEELNLVYSTCCPELTTIRTWYMMMKKGTFKISPEPHSGRKRSLEMIPLLKGAIDLDPSLSARKLGKIVQADPKTVSSKLHHELEMTQKSLKWIPHELQPCHIEKRRELSAELLELLKVQESEHFSRIFTGDESWIMYDNPSKRCWVKKGNDAPEHQRLSISSKKLLLSVFFSGQKVWHISFLPVGVSMNSKQFVDTVLKPLRDSVEQTQPEMIRPWFLHSDNARPHVSVKTETFLKTTAFLRVQAPAYSPDLAPSDFYLFGTLKNHLEGKTFSTAEELKCAVRTFLEGLGEKELLPVFQNWKKRCEQVREFGNYYESKKK
jgi:histone-lysine N-methyltransferase SETMAR